MNSSAQQWRAVREVTPGTLPAGNMTVFPFASMDVDSTMQRGGTDDVSAHGQAEDNVAEDLQIQGSGSGDFRMTLRDQLREEVFRNTFSATVTATSVLIAAVASGNKLTRAAGWGSRAAGDLVWVTGFVTNGAAFAARVSAVSGNDLTFSWPTLVDESAGPSVTVADVGQLVIGTSLLTSYWERWNTKLSKGKKFPGVAAGSWELSFDFPKRFKEAFQFMGAFAGTRLSAQLANGTTAAASRRVLNSATNFGDKTVTGSQMGLRHNGLLLTDCILKSLKVNITSPHLVEGGAGTLGPTLIGLDDIVTAKIDATILNTGTDSNTLVDAAGDPNAEYSLGFGLRDPDGKRCYLWAPKAQPLNGKNSGLKRQGAETIELSWMLRYDTTDGLLRYANLT